MFGIQIYHNKGHDKNRVDMNTKSTVAILAIVAISTILVGSVLAEDAFAKKCRRSGGGNDNSVHQTSAQACINQNAPCQNANSQNAGSDIASNTFGIQ
jgi:hypothetical protein